jgi:hypothetical protein
MASDGVTDCLLRQERLNSRLWCCKVSRLIAKCCRIKNKFLLRVPAACLHRSRAQNFCASPGELKTPSKLSKLSVWPVCAKYKYDCWVLYFPCWKRKEKNRYWNELNALNILFWRENYIKAARESGWYLYRRLTGAELSYHMTAALPTTQPVAICILEELSSSRNRSWEMKISETAYLLRSCYSATGVSHFLLSISTCFPNSI